MSSDSELSDAPAYLEDPQDFCLTPPPSQSGDRDDSSVHHNEDMPPSRKRRRIDVVERKTRNLQLDGDLDREADNEALNLMLRALRKRRKIVVVAGAGISVSAGIPDFRSSHGLFRTLKDEHKLKASGKQLFDASVYHNDSSTESFHDMVRSLSDLSAKAQPTLFHQLLARLAKEERLLRLYTQNVDGLELALPPLATQVPLNHKAPWPRTIQLHGGLEKMVCHKCKHISQFNPELFTGATPPLCQECVERDSVRTTYAGKRSHGVGRLRPRIVLYNEANPDEDAIGAVVAADLRARPDAVIVVGTSLKIPPVRRIVKEMCLTTRGRQNGITMMINKETLTLGKDLDDCFDILIEGESDEVARMANLRDWTDDNVGDIEEVTASDIERAKSRQISVLISTPKKKKQTFLTSSGILTPPISVDEEIKMEGEASDSTHEGTTKNPASSGRSLADVLGYSNKENRQKKSKTNSMLKTVTSTKPKKPPKNTKKPSIAAKQSRITGTVSKANTISVEVKDSDRSASAARSASSKPLGPISTVAPRNNATVLFPNLGGMDRRQSSDSAGSIGSTIIATSGSDDNQLKRKEPCSSRLPADIARLLN